MSEKVRNCPIQKKSLDPRQQAAVDLIALGRAMTEVARSIAVDRRTLYRWTHHDPHFRAALAHRQRELWSQASSRLQGMVNPALDVLDQHLNGQQYDRLRLRAALSILRLTDLRRRRPEGPEEDEDIDDQACGEDDALALPRNEVEPAPEPPEPVAPAVSPERPDPADHEADCKSEAATTIAATAFSALPGAASVSDNPVDRRPVYPHAPPGQDAFPRTPRAMRLLLLFSLLSGTLSLGCAARTVPRPPDPTAGSDRAGPRLSLPSLGISLPTPSGWAPDPERIGSIGSTLMGTWLRPVTPGAAEADARIVLIVLNPKAFKNLHAGVQVEQAPAVDGKPAFRWTPAPLSDPQGRKADGGLEWSERFIEAWQLQAHDLSFLLVLEATGSIESSRATLRTMAKGVRWSQPVPAHEALAMSGQFTGMGSDADLWFDIPYPFVNNPFRGEHYNAYSLVEHSAGSAYFELESLKDVRNANAATQAARDTPSYYETHGWDLSWREVSREPQVLVGVTKPTAPDAEGTVWNHKVIIARSGAGRYYRVLFGIDGRDREVLKRYEALVDEVARSFTTHPPPVVPRFPDPAR